MATSHFEALFYVAVTLCQHDAHMPRVSRFLVVLLLSAVSCLGATSPASAHVSLVWSFPSAGASLPHSPGTVALDAGDRVNVDVSQIIVRDALGEVQPLDGPRLARNGTVLVGGLAGGGARGQWQVSYRLVGEDGHAVTGRIDFAVGVPVAVPDEEGSNLGLWLVVGGAAALLVAAWYLRWSIARAISQPVPRPARQPARAE